MQTLPRPTGATPWESYTIPLPPGTKGLDVGLAILDLLEDRFRAQLVGFELRDRGGSFTVRLPLMAVQQPAPGNAATGSAA
jgi:hypothetical protein